MVAAARGGVGRSAGGGDGLARGRGDWPALRARRRRWAERLRLVFKVDVEVCARCGGEARIVGFVTESAVVRRILAHLERHGVDARAGPWAGAAAAPG